MKPIINYLKSKRESLIKAAEYYHVETGEKLEEIEKIDKAIKVYESMQSAIDKCANKYVNNKYNRNKYE